MATKRPTASDVLRDAIRASGISQYRIAKDTGLERASLLRFMRKERSLHLDLAERLFEYLGLELRPARRR